MRLLYLTQSNNQELNLTSDGFTDNLEMDSLNDIGKELQIVRNPVGNVGQPLITFQISNNGSDWSDWEIVGFIFKDSNWMFEFEKTRHTFFRLFWLSNSSTGTFTANFNGI